MGHGGAINGRIILLFCRYVCRIYSYELMQAFVHVFMFNEGKRERNKMNKKINRETYG